MFFISVDIDLLDKLKKRKTIINNEINNKTHNERRHSGRRNNDAGQFNII